MRFWCAALVVLVGCAEADMGGFADASASADARRSPDARSNPDASSGADATPSADALVSADAAPSADAVSSADATPSADAAPGSDGGPVAYSHTIAIDGSNDFTVADERFDTSTTGFYTYVSWDSMYVYLGVEGTDVGSGSATRWVLVYLGGSGGTTTGQSYNSQEPTLPFSARYHVRWRADNGLTSAQEYTSSAWTPLSWDFTGDVYQSGTFLELRIPRADIGSPSSLQLHVSMINEQGGSEWTFAGTPSTTFTDGYDADYGTYYQFDLGAATAPTSYAPM